jgi:RNB domain
VGSRQQELAIFVRHCDFQAQFYTMSGRWIARTDKHPQFYVPNFVESHELDAIRPYLPQEVIPREEEDRLHSFEIAPPRNIGQPLTTKMAEFWAAADIAYQKAASRFDNAHRLVAHPTRFTYATLAEIAEKTLSGFVPKTEDGKFSQEVLYALHRSLLRDDIGFRIQPAGTMRTGGEYEINSIGEVNSINHVTQLIRSYRKALVEDPGSLSSHPLTRFADEARRLIAASRQTRQLTPYGSIGPYSGKQKGDRPFRYGQPYRPYKDYMQHFLRFLESWACLDSFSKYTSLNGIGSTILRAIGAYEDMPLDKKTAWTALQEMGAIAPWESRAAYELRLPHTGRRLAPGLFTKEFYEKRKSISHRKIEPDALEHLRKDWGDLPVYCVDDASAQEIDDGISVERTENPEEFWVHVHVADPAAHIDWNSTSSIAAEHLTSTIYFPERSVALLRQVRDHGEFSLASGRPCLTFSARMNLNGEVLESIITPGIVRNVISMTYEVLKEVTTGSESLSQSLKYVVGLDRAEPAPSRELIESHQMSDVNRKELEILDKIQQGRWKYLGERGGAFKRPPRLSVSVDFDGAAWEKTAIKDSMHYYGDPTIRLYSPDMNTTSDLGLVPCFMLVAGEVAGRWCSARGIPVPYRVTPLNPEKDPAEYFANVLLPARKEFGEAPLEIQMEYTRQISAVQPSTTPGRHVAIGQDMMVRCTSPLRRFADLLSHWQIEAALLEEHRLGHSLVGNTREDFLPFSKARIDAFLPRLALREKLIDRAQQFAERAWAVQFLLRTWHFKEAELPSPLFMSIRSINPDTRLCGGLIEQLSLGSQMMIPDGMEAEDIKLDDRFEVEIDNIDCWANNIYCKLIRRVEPEESAA